MVGLSWTAGSTADIYTQLTQLLEREKEREREREREEGLARLSRYLREKSKSCLLTDI